MEKSEEQAWLRALLSLFCQQKTLVPGEVDITTFRVLAELARMRNPRIVNALEVYLVQGESREHACSMYGVDSSYFSRRLMALNRVWQLTELLKIDQNKIAGIGGTRDVKHDEQSET
ncbi:hypothetical protein ITK37_004637 [Salmonella enterica]|nr:hypothetical protein [Salmonella enterica]EJR4301105.1 hypothetical protein [Salmonella enterica]EJR4403540.1 hypothetical protein [Salmonella enterica]